jgi:hypothetical protein
MALLDAASTAVVLPDAVSRDAVRWVDSMVVRMALVVVVASTVEAVAGSTVEVVADSMVGAAAGSTVEVAAGPTVVEVDTVAADTANRQQRSPNGRQATLAGRFFFENRDLANLRN